MVYGTVNIPGSVNIRNAGIKVETVNDYKNFIINNFYIASLPCGATGEQAGYTRVIFGQPGDPTRSYTSNYSLYDIDLDEESATNPLNLGEYVDDTDFNNRTDFIVTLTKDDGKNWKNTWNNPTEDKNHCKYLYYVEEIGIGNEPNQHQIVAHTEDGNTYYMSDDEQYLVTYRNEYVATNDESNPITITNKDIWYKLPATGGIGTDKIYLLSIMLITIGITSGCFIYSRKRRLDENS